MNAGIPVVRAWIKGNSIATCIYSYMYIATFAIVALVLFKYMVHGWKDQK